MPHKALLEIGTEEIPAKKVKKIHNNLKKVTDKILTEYRVEVEEIEIVGAPRRMTVILNNVSEFQKDLTEEIKGPPVNIAFDEDNNPTKAAEGFASSQNLDVDELEIKDTDNGKYLYAVIERKNQPVVQLLPDIFTEIITSLNFPISMRWSNYDLEFIRPVHWICALYDNEVIKLSINGIKSGNISRGHRFLSEGKVNINSADEYKDKLRENYVIVDPEERKKLILKGIKEIEKKVGGEVEKDKELMDEVNHLVEYPTPFCGEFENRFLELPDPVLVTPTKEHQRYFPVRDQNEDLMAKFVGVRDGGSKYLDIVKEGNEKVLRARFADAEFYYKKDLQETMEDRIKKLDGIVFREELGTMLVKIKRVKKLVSGLGDKLNLDNKIISEAERAAYLAKADLTSHMVREFPELQGKMGEIYARREGEKEIVCKVIAEHYYPRFSGDTLPETIQGKIVSLADKLDTLIGCFGIGLIPSGSEDPYGLRRAAIGIIRIIKSANIKIDLNELCNISINLFQNLTRPEEDVLDEVIEYIFERIENMLLEKNIPNDILKAVIAEFPPNIPHIVEGAKFLNKIKNKDKFKELVTVFNRIESIVENNKIDKINSDLLLEKSEKKLYNMYLDVDKKILKVSSKDSLEEIYKLLTEFINPVNEFFEEVIVMTDREEVRKNRLNLLNNILEEMKLIGDLSQIVME
ncbi:MAG: glycine--tRNA ligase subunit beta [Halanaerobiales bacterium]